MTRQYLDRARERVSEEEAALTAKVDAYRSFIDRVREVPTESATPEMLTAGASPDTRQAPSDGCVAVRTAFAETVCPESVPDGDSEPLVETIRSELSEAVAATLAPTGGAVFTDECKRVTLAQAETRQAETGVTRRAVEREAASLESVADTVDLVRNWLHSADETPLDELGFDDLRRRHRRLSAFGDRCETAARERQAHVDRATSRGDLGGVTHRGLVSYLYEGFPVDYPALVTTASLARTCRDCRRVVRAHLVRRA
jgi:hypothetical protein